MSRGLLNRDVVDAAELVGRAANELSRDALANLRDAASGGNESRVIERHRDAFFQRQVPKLIVVIVDRQRSPRLDCLWKTRNVDVGYSTAVAVSR